MNGRSPSAVRTACPYCGVGCGVLATPQADGSVLVEGDPVHPANAGRLCSKGAALGKTLGERGRLLHPVVDGRLAGWDAAIDVVASRFSAVIEEHGPDAVAFYVSGQLLTEDYYAANKLMKGFIGSGNIDTNSRLCMASAVSAHKTAFGADLVPAVYEDVELADLLVLAGHNAAWTHPVLFRRIEAAAREGRRLVCIDPRRTDTAEASDLHLPLNPQTDVRLWNGLAAWLDRRGGIDGVFVDSHVNGLSDLRDVLAAADQSVSAVARDCGLAAADVETFYRWFAETPRVVTLFSQGVNQSAQGVAKGSSIINAHLLTGKIGKPGAAPFSITGQPNAMGGREVGGLATMLAAHMDFSDECRDRVGRFWKAPNVARGPGLKAVDLFDAVGRGEIKALWVMATNPAVSLPDADRVRRALDACEFLVVSDVVADTDTAKYADVLLPARAWGEKSGTVTNSDRTISRQRSFLKAPGEALADWRIVAKVAAAMGWGEAFAWTRPAEVFREWAAMTAFENDGARPLDLGGLADISVEEYEDMAPVRWPCPRAGAPKNGEPTERLFEDGRFATPDGKARLAPTPARPPAQSTGEAYRFALTTSRVRDQWHTMTRTARAPELCRHAPEPALELNPADAEALGVRDGVLVEVKTPSGAGIFAASITSALRPGVVSVPMHWTDAFAPAGRANALTASHCDPDSGQPEFKHAPARLRAYGETWRGFAAVRGRIDWPRGVVWRRTPFAAAEVFEIAGRGGAGQRDAAIAAALAADLADRAESEALTLDDEARGLARRAVLADGRLHAAVFVGPPTVGLPPRAWIAERFADAALSPADRAALLLGRSVDAPDEGALVCACMGVGRRRIDAAIASGATSVDAIGGATGAGTSCGSCRPELSRFLAETRSVADKVAAEVSDAA